MVVAEPVRGRFEHGKGVHVGHLLRRVGAPRREGNLHVVPGLLRGRLNGGAPTQNDHVRERDLLPAGLRAVEILLDFLEDRQDLREFGRLVDFPVLLRRKANARPVRSTAFVGAAERGRRSPGGCHQLRNGQSGCEDLGLELSDVLLPDQFMIDGGDGVLPQLRRGNQRAEQPRDGPHVAVRQLVPRLGKGFGELVRVLVEALRDRRVDRVQLQGEVRREHHGGVLLRRIVSIRHGALCRCLLGSATATRRPDPSPAPTRSRTGCRSSRCPTSPGWWSRRPPGRW